ncbi:hypothetical protein AUC43_10670 [Hymenobacter sedentarius]|uniref:Uncharacterized protein n=1 Tax=Hymenobacter sedentarius TaxID=1411621 RepID=A0A0U4CBE6_9BACT|nr:hypothetical protein AUC43_10670 [Hymenobacter sedentarius]
MNENSLIFEEVFINDGVKNLAGNKPMAANPAVLLVQSRLLAFPNRIQRVANRAMLGFGYINTLWCLAAPFADGLERTGPSADCSTGGAH